MMQALELLQLTKSTSWDNATFNSEEIKPIANLSGYRVMPVSQSVRWPVGQSVGRSDSQPAEIC